MTSSEDDEHVPFMRQPFCIYKGHSADLLDVSWSKVQPHCCLYRLRVEAFATVSLLLKYVYMYGRNYRVSVLVCPTGNGDAD